MGCEQGLCRSARRPFPTALLLLVVVLLIDLGLCDRSSEEKRNKKLAAEKASLASGKVSVQNSEGDTNTSKAEQPDDIAEEVVKTMYELTERQAALKQEQKDLQEKLEREKNERDRVDKKLGDLRGDLKTMLRNKQTCERRIEMAREKMVNMSATYEFLIARAEQAITCLTGDCNEADLTFAYKIPKSFEKRMKAANQDFKLSATKANPNTQSQKGSLKDETGFFKDIKLSTTGMSPTERQSITDGKDTITNKFFDQEALKDHFQKGAENTFEDGKLSTTEKSPTEKDVITDAETTTLGGKFFNEEAIRKAQMGQVQFEGSNGTTTPQAATVAQNKGSFFKPDVVNELKKVSQGGAATTKEAMQTQTTAKYINLGASDGMFFNKDAKNKIQQDLKNARAAASGQTKNFCEEGTLDGNWFHGTKTESGGGKPEQIKGNTLVFADGHAEQYECSFDLNKGTEITFTMMVGQRKDPFKFEGKLLNDGNLIEWNDNDFWHKKKAEAGS